MTHEPWSTRYEHYCHVVHRRTALKLPLYLAAGAALTKVPLASAETSRWSADRANAWYAGQGWLLGANYVTSNAVNQLEMFQAGTYDPRRIAGELSVARRIGMNTMRVFLHDQLWATDRAGFSSRLSEFVAIAASHNIKPLFVLFDSCWDPLPQAGRQRAPIKGVHNSGWVQSPGAHRLQDPAYTRVLQSYVTGVVGMFANDPRVLGWDVWNEPDNPSRDYRKVEHKDKLELVAAFLPHVFQWARAVNPVQPLTSGVWQGHWRDPGSRSTICSLQLEHSDVISFHSYGDPGRVRGPHRRTHAAGTTDSLHRVSGAEPGQHCGRNPSGRQETQRRRLQLGLRRRADADVSAVGFVEAALHLASGNVVQRSDSPRRSAP